MINITICDDERDYAEILEFKLKQFFIQLNFEYTISIFSDLNDYKNYIDTQKTDISFFDIMINNINSIEWIKENPLPPSAQIIIMTAFPEETYDLSEINCCYYFIKSHLTSEKLEKALNKAIKNLTQKSTDNLIIKSGAKNHIIEPQNIMYIEAFDNYITIKTKHSEQFTVHSTVKSFIKKLPPCFFRCHKSYIINMNHITGYDSQNFYISSGEKIPFPKKKQASVIETYKKFISVV